MSPDRRKSSRRSASAGRKSAPQEPAAQEEELDVLEPIEDDEELDVLEPIEDDEELDSLEMIEEDDPAETALPVHLDTVEDGSVDLRLRVELGDMDRSEIAEAVVAPLRRAAREHGPAMRWKQVQILFDTQEVAPSKVKATVEELFADAKPAKLIVQRGYGDETVLENEAPNAAFDVDADAGDPQRLRVRVTGAGDLAPQDLPVVLAGDLDKLCAEASGKSFELSFAGAPAPAPLFVEQLRSQLAGAGAVRASLQAADGADSEVLFDRELEQMVRIAESGADDFDTELVLAPGDDEDTLRRALDMVLPAAKGLIQGKRIRARVEGRELQAAELAGLEQQLLGLKLGRLELAGSDGAVDLVLPHLLRSNSKGNRTLLGVVLGGRDHGAVETAFARECATLGEKIAGQQVMVDWPEGFDIDESTEERLGKDVLAPIGPAGVVFSFRGKESWPVLPKPLDFRTETDEFGEIVIGRLDTDAARPADLGRAVERRARNNAAHLEGKRTRIEVVGEGAVSRTLRKTVHGQLQQVGVKSAEFVERDVTDVLLPMMLSTSGSGSELDIAIDPAWRSAEQVELALDRELGDVEVGADTSVTVNDVDAAAPLTAALIRKGAGRVLKRSGETSMQLHPALLTAQRDGSVLQVGAAPHPAADAASLEEQVAREGAALLAEHGGSLDGVEVTVGWPGAGATDEGPVRSLLDSMKGAGCAVLKLDGGTGRAVQLHPEVVREPVHVLGRNDGATPPMKLLGVDWSDDPLDAAGLEKQIDGMADDLRDHRVLVAFQAPPGQDVEVSDSDPMAAALVAKLEGLAGASLLYRDGSGRPHFQVVASKVDGLDVGAKFNDPRAATQG